MAEIYIQSAETAQGWRFAVVVREGASQTRHEVTLARTDYERLSGGRVPPERLVEASFAYLLEREPKESILPSFDLPVIGRYFPGYEQELGRRLTP